MANSADLSVSVALTGEQQAVTAIQQINAALKINIEVTQKAAEAARAESAALSSTLPSVRGVTDALGQQTAQLRAQRDAMKTDEYQKYAAQQKAIRAEIEQMTAPQQQNASGWLTMGNAVRGFVAVQAVGYIKSMGGAIFDATAEMQSLRIGMTAVMKSSTLANSELAALKETAKLPGLGYAEAIRMSVSLQSAGFSAAQARKSMEAFGNALATVGKGKADLDGVGLALTQIMSKGKVSAEEIYQIAERVPQIRIAMQDAFGTASTGMIQAMGLTSGQFVRGITDELGKLEKVTGGLKNGAENLSDAWFQLKANIGGTGRVFSQAQQAVAALLNTINEKMESGQKSSERMAQLFATYGIAVSKSAIINAINLKRMTADEQKWVENGIYNGAVYAAQMVKQQEIMGEKLTDGQKEILKREGAIKAKSREADLAAEAIKHKLDIKDAGDNAKAKEIIEAEHQARLAEIKAKWNKKDAVGKPKIKEDLGWNDPSRVAEAKTYAKRIQAAESARRKEAAETYKREEDRYRDDENKSKSRAWMKQYHEEEAQERRMLEMKRNYALEYQAFHDEQVEKDRAAYQAIAQSSSEAFMTMADVMDKSYGRQSESYKAMFTLAKGFAIAKAALAMQENIAEAMSYGWPQNMVLMAGAAAQGAIVISDIQAITQSYDVGTRKVRGDQLARIHNDEAIFTAPVSRAMRAGDWGPAMRFMGQGGGSSTSSTSSQTNHITVNVAGTNASPQAIAQVISRAIPIQQRKGARSSF